MWLLESNIMGSIAVEMKYLKKSKDCFLHCLSKNIAYSAYTFRKGNRGGNTCFYSVRTVAVLAGKALPGSISFRDDHQHSKSLSYHSRRPNQNVFSLHASLSPLISGF